jgi:hypothetical protein
VGVMRVVGETTPRAESGESEEEGGEESAQ